MKSIICMPRVLDNVVVRGCALVWIQSSVAGCWFGAKCCVFVLLGHHYCELCKVGQTCIQTSLNNRKRQIGRQDRKRLPAEARVYNQPGVPDFIASAGTRNSRRR